jgi:3-hydroxyacyl-CoA dehydrogenase/enoyl-CoA hydratase/3-hydroxybutyryl-CoA epimerase
MTGYQAVDSHGEGHGPIGLDAFLARADELADRYGERFRPTAYLRDLAAKGEGFPG